ncbi:NAD-dependent succinate-semialdehyde dehydrogenase [Novosphingobium flavum]|uniref:NAD-dependent succinate-semialdehyde dehydrogenase n=1 Tax=Novosphingobium flavum TaxID=1778672 RepID=A0A7X1KKK5_9SPHN|nr:NAD-dependent succinate-semialdehyde dehydrogenase [Novosphingobium flavum]
MNDTCDAAPFIAGEWRGAKDRLAQPIFNPATGAEIGRVVHANAADLDDALAATNRGFRAFRAISPDERARILVSAAANLRARAARIARTVTLEQGKPLAEALGEVSAAAALLDFHAGEAVRIYGRVLMRAPGSRSLVLHQPVGPVAAFCAWNFPVLNPVRKLGPALAAGCSIILKPSEETPASASEVLRCFLDAGLPPDTAQLVFGDPDAISRHLLASPVTRKLSFTGSVSVGKHLMKLAAETVMKMTMELGGHAPVLVFEDCQLDRTLDILAAHKFRNAGQVCIAPTRFYVQEDIYDAFVGGFAERARALPVGNGLDAVNRMGPMANPRRPEVIAAMVEDARSVGARLVAGGTAGDGSGYFFAPTVLANVPPAAQVMNEEPFGPVALICPFSDDDDAIAKANRLPFGLAAYCFTENGRRQNLMGDAIEAGMVLINQVRATWPDAPFGGLKESGFGSEDGPEGVAAHLNAKAVHIA